MNFYVVLYHRKHTAHPFIFRGNTPPTEEQIVKALTSRGQEVTLRRRKPEHLEIVESKVIHHAEPELNKKVCDDGGCPGWGIFNDGQIQRCDTCQRFRDDDEAIGYVKSLQAVDVGRHLDAAAHRALVSVREDLSSIIDDYSKDGDAGLRGRLEMLLGRSYWLERHRWTEHSMQFARLLSEIYSIGESSEDTDVVREDPEVEEPGFWSIKIKDLEDSMDLGWDDILSIFERADAVFQDDKLTIHLVKPEE